MRYAKNISVGFLSILVALSMPFPFSTINSDPQIVYADHFEISIPDSMNVNDEYLGHIRLSDTSSNVRSIVLLSNTTSITIPNRVTIPADSQAATFEIYPTDIGNFEITALFDGVTHRTTFTVFDADTIVNTEETAIHLWIPDNVVAGTQYSGYILLDEYSQNNRVISMVGSEGITLSDNITVLAQSYSVLFQFTPLQEGEAFIIAATDGESSRVETTVHEANSVSTTKRISLYTHNSTVSGKIAIIVSLESGTGIPIAMPEDTIIHLKGTSGINVQSSITIKAGQSQGLTYATINNDGTISALSTKFRTGTVDISTGKKDLSIRIDAAPSPGLVGSVGYFFVWLENEDGEIYRKNGVTEVFLTSTEREIISFGKGRPSSHGIITVSMINGLYGGELYLGRDGSADITASTSGYGTDTIRMNVGSEKLESQCGVYLIDGVVTTVTLEMQQDVRSVLGDALDSVKDTLDDAGPRNTFADIRDVRQELYRYDVENHNSLANAVLELNESINNNSDTDVSSNIDVGDTQLNRDELQDVYLELAKLSVDIIPLDSRSIQSAIGNVRDAIVYYEFNGNRDKIVWAVNSLKIILKESGYGDLIQPLNSAVDRLSSSGTTTEMTLLNARTTLTRIGTSESLALLDALLAYTGEKTIERIYVERSRAAIDALEAHTLLNSTTFNLPSDASKLYINNDIEDGPDRQSILELTSSISIMHDTTTLLDNSFLDRSLDSLSEELRVLLAMDAVNQVTASISHLPILANGTNTRSMIEDSLVELLAGTDPNERAAEIIATMITEFGNGETLEDALANLDAALILLQNDSSGRINLIFGDIESTAGTITLWDLATSYAVPLDILSDNFIIPDHVITTLLAVDRIPGYTIQGIKQNVFLYTHIESATDIADLVDADLASMSNNYDDANEVVNAVLSAGGTGGGGGNVLRLALDNLSLKFSSENRASAYDTYNVFVSVLNDYYRDSNLADDTMDAFFNFQYALTRAGITHDISAIGDAIEVLYLEVDDDPRESKPVISTQITLDIIPDTTDSTAYGVVAQYVMRDIIEGDDGSVCLVEPDEIGHYSRASRGIVNFSGQLDGGGSDNIVVSSTGDVSHERVLRPDDIQKDGRHRGAILFEIESYDEGEHTVMVSVDDHGIIGLPETINSVSYIRVSGSDGSATFTVQEQQDRTLDFVSVPVPEDGGIVGIVAVLQDESVIRHDIEIVKGNDINIERVADQYVVYGKNDAYFGTLTSFDVQPLDISADVADVSDDSSVILDIPERVRVGEPFPYYFHVFENGVPMNPNSGGRVSLPDIFVTFTGNEILIPSSGDNYKITVLSSAGVITETIEAISSPLIVQTTTPPVNAQVGEDFYIQFNSQIQDIVYKIQSAIPSQYIENNNEVKFSPQVEGTFPVSIVGTRSGYEPYVNEFSVLVENTLNIRIASVGTEKVQFEMILAGKNLNGTITPWSLKNNPTNISVTFPLQYSDETGGYKFEKIRIGPTREFMSDLTDNTFSTHLQTNLYIDAYYTRNISVTVLGGSGSGVYENGDIVTVSATDLEIIPVLMYERFDEWDGPIQLSGSTDTFIAEYDVVITAKYYTDHSTWMIIILVSIAVVVGVITIKRSSKFAWMLKNTGLSK